jgi:tetratricopeptide (TPR) repeat protein
VGGESQPRDEDPLVVLGAALRRRRISRGLSLRVLARKLGLSGHSGIVDYERGRRLVPGDLMDAYQRVLADTSGELSRLRDAVLTARATAPVAAGDASGPEIAMSVPFPADLADFVGRDWELAELEALLDHPPSHTAPVVLAISGPPGVGKTSVAVHLAHRLASRYPDALFYLDLHGTAPESTDTGAALWRLLRGLGVPATEIPPDSDDRSALFRSLLYHQRTLVLLDDAAHEDQVRALLPAGPQALVVVTSRSPLSGLEAAHHLRLDRMRPDAAVDLLASVIGRARVLAEPEAAACIVEYCGLLPLATRIAAARLASWPQATLADWADTLADARQRLDWLESGDRAVRAAFAASYEALPADAQRLLRRLALIPGTGFGADAAGAVLGEPATVARQLLSALADVGLVQPADAPGRYRFHDLITLFAEERLDVDDDLAARERAMRRLVEWALRTADEAGRMLDPSGYTSPGPNRAFVTATAATRWLDDELPTVVGAVRTATKEDRAELVFPLVVSLPWFLDLRSHWETLRELGEHALASARQRDDRHQETLALNCLGLALHELRQPEEAATRCRQALDLATLDDDPMEQAAALNRLGRALTTMDRAAEAIGHLEQAILLNQAQGYRWEEATARNHLGLALRTLSRQEEAAEQHKRAATLFHAIGAVRGEGMARAQLGQTLSEAGRAEDAAIQYQLALARFLDGHDDWGQALALYGLGRMSWALGRTDEAADQLQRSALLFKNQNDPYRQTESLRLLSQINDITAE